MALKQGAKIPKALVCTKHIEAAQKSSDLFINSLMSRFSGKTLFLAVIIFLASFTLFATLAPSVLLTGDAATYAQIVANSDFSRITVHIGYYLLAALFTRLFPGPCDYALNLMSGLFGALSVTLLYLLTLTLTRRHSLAIVSALFLATNFLFVKNALYAEVYMTQTFFLLLALQLWLLTKPIPAGLSFALSTLVSPTSILAVPAFVILRPRKKALLQLATTTLVVLAPTLLPNYRDYLLGDRGLLRAASPTINMAGAVLKEYKEVTSGIFAYIPFVLLGIVQLFREKQFKVFGGALFCLWLFSFLLGERFRDVPTQLPTYALLCLVGGMGVQLFSTILRRTSKRSRTTYSLVIFVVLALVISISALRVLSKIGNKNRELVKFNNTIVEMSQVIRPDCLLVGRWGQGVLFHYYAVQRGLDEHTFSRQWLKQHWINAGSLLQESGDEQVQAESIQRWQDAITSGREIWLFQECAPLFEELREGGYTVERFKKVFRASKGQLRAAQMILPG